MPLAQAITNPEIEEALFYWEERRRDSPSGDYQDAVNAFPQFATILPELLEELKEMDWLDSLDDAAGEKEGNNQSAPHNFSFVPGNCPIPDYCLIRKIGQGSFAEVWEASGPGKVHLALKIIPMQNGVNLPEIRSLEILKNIRHPHLISIFGYWIKENYLWIAMELADSNLLDFGKNDCGSEKIKHLFVEAAEAIDFLNSPIHPDESGKVLGILHRDIKPQNLLIVGNCLKVGDFGLARILEPQRNEHSGCMTPLYAPPEFFRGEMHPNSDQYSLAITYCKLASGKTPFEGTADEIVFGHLNGKPNLEAILTGNRYALKKALSKNPEQRYPNCSQFIEELYSPPKVDSHFGAKLKRLSALAACLLVLFGLVALFGFNSGKQKEYFETVLSGHKGPVSAVAISADGKTAISCGEDKQVIGWDLELKKQIFAETRHSQKILSVDISRDGKLAMSGGAKDDQKIFLWDVQQGKFVKELTGHQHGVRSVKFLPEESRAVSCGFDGTARLWDLEKGLEIHKFEGLDTYSGMNLPIDWPRQVWNLDITGDGKKSFSFLRTGKILEHEIETGKMLQTFTGKEHIFKSISLDHIGEYALTTYGGSSINLGGEYLEAVLWNFRDNTKQTIATSASEVECCHLDMKKNTALFFPNNGRPFSVDVITGSRVEVFEKLEGNVRCLQFSENKGKLVLGCKDGTIRVLEKPSN